MNDLLHSVHEHYPEARALVAAKDVDRVAGLMCRSMGEMCDWTKDRLVIAELGGRSFRMLVDQAEDGNSDEVVLVAGEFANGFMMNNGINPAVVRARAIRDIVAPEATLVMQANDTINEGNHNLSRDERRRLRSGDAGPLVDRVRRHIGEASRVWAFGPSQGGVVVSAYAAHPDTAITGATVFETPNVRRRSTLQLGRDFMGSGKHLADQIRLNGYPDAKIVRAHLNSLTAMGMIRYGAGVVLPQNMAILGIMRAATLEPALLAALRKGAGVTHLWTTGDRVSPDSDNVQIAKGVRALPETGRYESYRFAGDLADHSSTNAIVVCAGGLRRARELGKVQSTNMEQA